MLPPNNISSPLYVYTAIYKYIEGHPVVFRCRKHPTGIMVVVSDITVVVFTAWRILKPANFPRLERVMDIKSPVPSHLVDDGLGLKKML